jgi:serine/threonine protein kinase
MDDRVREIILSEKRKFLSEPIIDINGTLRYVGGLIVETSGKDDKYKLSNNISEKYLDGIKSIASLSGTGEFLGSGSEGSAYRFGDKVLKVTKDLAEANAANKITGKVHPNVYSVHLVRRLPSSVFKRDIGPFIVVYDYLDYPSREMADVINQLENNIKWGKNKKDIHKLFYNWDDSYKNKILSLAKLLLSASVKHPFKQVNMKSNPHEKYLSLLNELDINLSVEDSTMLYSMLLFFGVWSGFDSFEDLNKLHSNLVSGLKLDYFCQLASGLTFLKRNGIDFEDLKSSNIMQRNGEIVIIDIGKSLVSDTSGIQSLTV